MFDASAGDDPFSGKDASASFVSNLACNAKRPAKEFLGLLGVSLKLATMPDNGATDHVSCAVQDVGQRAMTIADTAECLRIRVFGGFQMSLGGVPLQPFPTREAELLFVFLVLHRDRLFQREVLVDKLFLDQSASTARKRLRTAIWRIRSVLEPEGTAGGTYLTVTSREVGFNAASSYWLDVQEFESVISRVTSPTHKPLGLEEGRILTQALDLYRGDLLEGLYDEWCLWEQERLKALHLRGLETLMNFHAAKSDWHNAIVRGQQLLSHEPLREHIHRSLMRYYYLVGDRPAALRQYDSCAQLLYNELGIEPMRGTRILYDSIKEECTVADIGEEEIGTRQGTVGPMVPSEQDILAELYDCATELQEVTLKLRRGISLVEGIIHRGR